MRKNKFVMNHVISGVLESMVKDALNESLHLVIQIIKSSKCVSTIIDSPYAKNKVNGWLMDNCPGCDINKTVTVNTRGNFVRSPGLSWVI